MKPRIPRPAIDAAKPVRAPVVTRIPQIYLEEVICKDSRVSHSPGPDLREFGRWAKLFDQRAVVGGVSRACSSVRVLCVLRSDRQVRPAHGYQGSRHGGLRIV